MTTLTPLPPAPQRSDPTNFSTKADTWVNALEDVFTPQMNLIIPEINALSSAASTSASTATTKAAEAANSASLAQSAAGAAGAVAWVSGTYAAGDVRYSQINFQNYRRKNAGVSTVDPSLDSANWAILGVDPSAQFPFSNNTLLAQVQASTLLF